MKKTKYIIIVFIFFFYFINIEASYKQSIYMAYISNNMQKWKDIIDEMDKQKNKNNNLLEELINYQYGYIAWCIGNNKNDLGKHYQELLDKNLQILEKKINEKSIIYSYKSASYGYSIGLNNLLAPFLGPKSIDCAKLAIKHDRKNPHGYIQYGNSQYYMPAIFGGSKAIAIEYFTKAEKIMDANQIKDDWNYLSLLTIIAQAYTELKEYKKAQAYYEKILSIEPNFSWVKNGLYPDLLNKIKF